MTKKPWSGPRVMTRPERLLELRERKDKLMGEPHLTRRIMSELCSISREITTLEEILANEDEHAIHLGAGGAA